jgi:hypothetical protein
MPGVLGFALLYPTYITILLPGVLGFALLYPTYITILLLGMLGFALLYPTYITIPMPNDRRLDLQSSLVASDRVQPSRLPPKNPHCCRL